MRIIITEEQKKKLFIPRKQSGENSKWNQWNKEQPVKDGIRINQYTDDGLKTGIWEDYYSDGNLSRRGLYKDGEKEGIWESYWYNGDIISKGLYVNGKPEGIWGFYWLNGKIRTKGLYKNGKKEGIWEDYHENGNIMAKGLYKDGELIKKLPLNESEQPKKKLFIPRKQSGENSKWNDWNKEQPVKDGIRINQYTHDGIKTGIWEEYYNGNIEYRGSYKNGKREGIWEEYYSNGNLSRIGLYKNGEKEGIWEEYWYNGNIISKGPYKNGKKEGIWEEYWNNGDIKSKRLYKNGKLIKKLPLTENKTSSFLLKEEMILIKEGNIHNYVQNVLSKIKNLPYETKKKYITIAISTLLGYTSYPVIQSMFNKTSDKDVKEIVHNVVKKKKDPRFKDPTKMRLSSKGWKHIKNEETLQLKAYSIGDGMITVGYGHAEPILTSKYKVDQQISKEEADSLLGRDLKGAADGVRRIFKDFKKQGIDVNITQDMFDALVSMAFNSGVGGLRRTEVIRQIKNNNLKKAGELIKITNVNKKFPGLLKRRDKESDMFLSYLNQSNTIKA